MSCLSTLFWLIAAVAAVGYLLHRFYLPRSREDEIHFVTTSDGWRIALHRYRPRGSEGRGEPVFLHHGLTASGASFDLGVGTPRDPVPSPAHWLAERGYDVWAIDLRGRGASERPYFGGEKRWTWTVDDYIEKDDPAAIDYILATTGYTNLHWIGHSMGGILLFCHCALHGSPKVASGIAVGSGLAYGGTGSHYEPLIPASRAARFIGRMPSGILSKIVSPFCGRWGLHIERFNYNPENTAAAAGRAIYAGIISDTSAKVFYQLAKLFDADGFKSMDGAVRYVERAARVKTPMLLIAGDKDLQSSTALADKTRAAFQTDGHEVAYFGKEYGHANSYGHFDLLVGRDADAEVYPHILRWIKEHPARRRR